MPLDSEDLKQIIMVVRTELSTADDRAKAAGQKAIAAAEQNKFLAGRQDDAVMRMQRDPEKYAWAFVGLYLLAGVSLGANVALTLLLLAK